MKGVLNKAAAKCEAQEQHIMDAIDYILCCVDVVVNWGTISE
jgi:hypothetical protein